MTQSNFKQGMEVSEDLSLIVQNCLGEKSIAKNCVISALKLMARISNSNLMRKADGLIAKMDNDPKVKWVSKNKMRADTSKFKTSYEIF